MIHVCCSITIFKTLFSYPGKAQTAAVKRDAEIGVAQVKNINTLFMIVNTLKFYFYL